MPQRYCDADWDGHKQHIVDLYVTQDETMEQVCQSLRQKGFDISIRMLRGRIHRWKIDKNHKLQDMQTALKILVDTGYGADNAPPENLSFFIRGRVVSFSEILRYFRRKNISSPFTWLGQQDDHFEKCPDVRLLPGRDNTPSPPVDVSSTVSTGSPPTPNSSLRVERLNGPAQCRTGNNALMVVYFGDPHAIMDSPSTLRNTERLIFLTESYCSMYLKSPRAAFHVEHRVHRDTLHGRFGHKVQDGIAATMRGDRPEVATPYFQAAFDNLGLALQDDNPMILAQIYAVICELASGTVLTRDPPTHDLKQWMLHKLLMALLDFIAKMTCQNLDRNHPLRSIFSFPLDVEHIIDHSLRIMKRMVDSFAQDRSMTSGGDQWKLLYLRERFCDCLYHAESTGTRTALRAQLLEDQEIFYGKGASNVLWTLTNVADDHLDNHQPQQAKALFEVALQRAESLDGFSKAKSRFAALEGLAKTALFNQHLISARARLRYANNVTTEPRSSLDKQIQLLREAEGFCRQAETEARQWFGEDSRRTIRVSRFRADILDKLQSIPGGPQSAQVPSVSAHP